MKKQIGLITLIALLLTFVAFSGVASAQASNVQVVMFTSPFCDTCQKVKPLLDAAVAKYGVKLVVYDVTDQSLSKGVAQANGVTATPTIVISGAVPARFVGDVTQAQLETAIKAAIGNPATPTPVKPLQQQQTPFKATTPTPTPPKVVKATETPKKVVVVQATATPPPVVVKATATPTVSTQPNISVMQPTTQNQTTPTQTVPEFSLLGLGAPALIVGAIYLFMRRK